LADPALTEICVQNVTDWKQLLSTGALYTVMQLSRHVILLATVKAPLRVGAVHMFVCLSPMHVQKRDFLENQTI